MRIARHCTINSVNYQETVKSPTDTTIFSLLALLRYANHLVRAYCLCKRQPPTSAHARSDQENRNVDLSLHAISALQQCCL